MMNVTIVQEWLDHVKEDLDAAWSCVRGPRASRTRAAYLVQQAAEKLVKAGLVSCGIDPPYNHDIETLADGLPENFPFRRSFAALQALTPYHVGLRYPTPNEPPPIPTVEEIDDWIARIEALEADFERWLTGQGREPG